MVFDEFFVCFVGFVVKVVVEGFNLFVVVFGRELFMVFCLVYVDDYINNY